MIDDSDLLSHVRPPGWTNPTPRGRYDLVVLGAGTAGLVTAAGAAGLGAKVALVERDRMGGDCLNVGCVPSKALLAAARVAATARRAGEFGVSTTGVTVNFAAVMDRMRRLRASLAPHDSAERFRSLGIDVFLGEARFAGHDSVSVGRQALRFKRAAICTGAGATVPPIPGLAEAGFLTNETVFDVRSLPHRLVVLGGGPIGCELAQAFARFGCEVTLVEKHDRLLPKEDLDAAAIVRQSFERDGGRVLLESSVSSVEKTDGEPTVRIVGSGRGASETSSIPADAILVALGRQPNLESLDLAAAKVEFDPREGVIVDDRLRTTNRRVYAAGDVCSRFKFTHAADAMARIIIQNALFLGRKKASALTIPWCTYTSPELAHVGITPQQAEEDGLAIDTFTQPFASVDRNVLDGEIEGFARVHLKRGTDTIVGGTIIGEHAGDLIGLLSHAMTHGQGLKTFSSTIFPYPTRAEAFRKLGDAYNRTRLTPTAKRVLATWLKWT
ncbi:MAG: mercuric reductase [Planctomycetota bacterium]|nr:mercuric reductase [Planctomycetota bacterium]